MKYARVNDKGIVQEVFVAETGTIDDYFYVDVAKLFEPVADDVQANWRKNADGTYSAPPPPIPVKLPVTETPTTKPDII